MTPLLDIANLSHEHWFNRHWQDEWWEVRGRGPYRKVAIGFALGEL